ncbi:uncharacterized protein LOC111036356 [Myzus persicae]|uniref:uncharacterized protein LOC111036356 n=1 Tax=Myzus persicae TaxID=13164 RepID=UPI000B9324BF|nr:uncharacterized protein LOC111036356 [Myzus persicae]
MTVLTFPSVGGKSDKAPLIGDEEVHHGQTQPPPPYHPKFMETGEGGLPNTKNNNNGRARVVGACLHHSAEYRRLVHKMGKITVIMLAFILVLYFSIDTLCKAYVQDIQHKQQQETAEDAAVPCKSYSSYADAESDMLLLPELLPSSPPPSSKNLVISMVINPSEGIIKKVPQIVINKSARFLHDFDVNVTGIVDFENQRCYVMPLLRNSVEPPESLLDMLVKMSSGYYSMDINKILSNFRMVKPAINNLSDYGMYISKDCADYPTFKLEKDITTDSPLEVN